MITKLQLPTMPGQPGQQPNSEEIQAWGMENEYSVWPIEPWDDISWEEITMAQDSAQTLFAEESQGTLELALEPGIEEWMVYYRYAGHLVFQEKDESILIWPDPKGDLDEPHHDGPHHAFLLEPKDKTRMPANDMENLVEQIMNHSVTRGLTPEESISAAYNAIDRWDHRLGAGFILHAATSNPVT